MSVSIVVPCTPDRRALWDALQPRWQDEFPDAQLITCDEGWMPWTKGRAVASGVRAAAGDVLVVADADVWCTGTAAAVTAVEQRAMWAVPHCRILRYAADGRSLEVPPHPAVAGGGITVLRRAVWDACPMPVMGRREDEVWGVALTRQFGSPWRGLADLVHYWHERTADVS